MRINFLIFSIAATALIAVAIGCTGSAATEKEPKPLTTEALVKRGEYLVNIIGCDDCHSPKRMGPNGPEVIDELRFSGYPSSRPRTKANQEALEEGWMLFGPDLTSAAGPWGISYSANLTSDATGIGNWTEENFMRAIREGKWKGLKDSRSLLPPMPWFVYKNMSDDDLRSIFAYLRTTKPVNNVPPAPEPPKH